MWSLRSLARAWSRLWRRVARVAAVLSVPGDWSAIRRGAAADQLLAYRELARVYALDVRTILYIGANRGQGIALLRGAFPAADIHCFEPLAGPFSELSRRCARDPRSHAVRVAVGDRTGVAMLSRSGSHDQSSSLRQPNEAMAVHFPHVRDWTQEEVPCVTLDDWSADNPLTDDVLVKLDVQGAEDLVLSGGARTLARARAVIAELAIEPTYAGAPALADMLDRLRGLGFVYGGQLEVVRAPGTHAVVEFDGLFVKPAPTRGLVD